MSKTKKVRISNNKIDEIVKAANTETTVSWNGIEFHVKRTISLQEEIDITMSAVESVFGNNGTYTPEAAEISMYIGIIGSYTDIQLSDDLVKQYDLIFRTDIMDTILGNVDKDQIDRIKATVDEKVSHLRDTSVLASEMHIAEMTARVEMLFEKLDDIFSGVTHEDMATMIDSIGAMGNIDEEKVLKAYIEAAKAK